MAFFCPRWGQGGSGRVKTIEASTASVSASYASNSCCPYGHAMCTSQCRTRANATVRNLRCRHTMCCKRWWNLGKGQKVRRGPRRSSSVPPVILEARRGRVAVLEGEVAPVVLVLGVHRNLHVRPEDAACQCSRLWSAKGVKGPARQNHGSLEPLRDSSCGAFNARGPNPARGVDGARRRTSRIETEIAVKQKPSSSEEE